VELTAVSFSETGSRPGSVSGGSNGSATVEGLPRSSPTSATRVLARALVAVTAVSADSRPVESGPIAVCGRVLLLPFAHGTSGSFATTGSRSRLGSGLDVWTLAALARQEKVSFAACGAAGVDGPVVPVVGVVVVAVVPVGEGGAGVVGVVVVVVTGGVEGVPVVGVVGVVGVDGVVVAPRILKLSDFLQALPLPSGYEASTLYSPAPEAPSHTRTRKPPLASAENDPDGPIAGPLVWSIVYVSAWPARKPLPWRYTSVPTA
jgi:hypothetical protein